jgi:hypothetical protein
MAHSYSDTDSDYSGVIDPSNSLDSQGVGEVVVSDWLAEDDIIANNHLGLGSNQGSCLCDCILLR